MCLLNRSSSVKVVNNKLPWFLLFRFIDKTIDSKVDPARKLLISSFSHNTQKIANPQILIKHLHKFHAKLWRTLQNNSVITLGRRQHFSSLNFKWTVVLHSISNFWAQFEGGTYFIVQMLVSIWSFPLFYEPLFVILFPEMHLTYIH